MRAPAPSLRYTILGKTGLKITKFVFGSMITNDPTVIERAYDLGINCFATARDYQNGNNERLLGSALKGKRHKIVLMTESIDMMWRPKSERETTEYALNTLNASLKELGTDYVDVWFLHHKDSPEAVTDEVLEAVRIGKKQGKFRHAGITTHELPKLTDYLANSGVFEVVIPIYNFTLGEEMHAAVKKVHDAGVGVIAMKVMAGGLRSKTPNPKMQRPGAIMAALQWALNHPHVDAAVSSVSEIEQLEENVRAMSEPFTDRERQLLAAVLEQYGPEYCRMCGRCKGTCAKGLPVSEIMRCGMYAEGYGQFALGREGFLRLPSHVREPNCNRCPACTVSCAYGIRVAELVSRTQQLLG
jgi:aryl-alcohol dehydrogenase-like predicted oxidoreductase